MAGPGGGLKPPHSARPKNSSMEQDACQWTSWLKQPVCCLLPKNKRGGHSDSQKVGSLWGGLPVVSSHPHYAHSLTTECWETLLPHHLLGLQQKSLQWYLGIRVLRIVFAQIGLTSSSTKSFEDRGFGLRVLLVLFAAHFSWLNRLTSMPLLLGLESRQEGQGFAKSCKSWDDRGNYSWKGSWCKGWDPCPAC